MQNYITILLPTNINYKFINIHKKNYLYFYNNFYSFYFLISENNFILLSKSTNS